MKRKTLTTALLAGLTGTVGIANMSGAVNINPDGLGQALVYPYYTVNNDTLTLVSVVNTTDQVKAVKVRYLEGENSREVLDFNLYLSPRDVWTAFLFGDDTGAGQQGTDDNSCTVPNRVSDEIITFRDTAYTAVLNDTGSQDLERTREGYLEMLEMGVVTDPTLAAAATHDGTGVPTSCVALEAAWDAGGQWANASDDGVAPPSGGLFGGASLVRVEAGTDVAYNARALDAWSALVNHSFPGSTSPRLDEAFPPQSIVFDNGQVVQSDWASGADAVSALFMHDAIMNEYVLDPGTASQTEWVITFPTKRFYVDTAFQTAANPPAPFTHEFQGDADGDGLSCDVIQLDIWDREERTTDEPLDVSPPQQGAQNELCFEVNVLRFRDPTGPGLFGSRLAANVPVPSNFDNGWLRLRFDDPDTGGPDNVLISQDQDVYIGLPATGFAVQTFTNGDVGGVLSNYAGLFDHRATREISSGSTID